MNIKILFSNWGCNWR